MNTKCDVIVDAWLGLMLLQVGSWNCSIHSKQCQPSSCILSSQVKAAYRGVECGVTNEDIKFFIQSRRLAMRSWSLTLLEIVVVGKVLAEVGSLPVQTADTTLSGNLYPGRKTINMHSTK